MHFGLEDRGYGVRVLARPFLFFISTIFRLCYEYDRIETGDPIVDYDNYLYNYRD